MQRARVKICMGGARLSQILHCKKQDTSVATASFTVFTLECISPGFIESPFMPSKRASCLAISSAPLSCIFFMKATSFSEQPLVSSTRHLAARLSWRMMKSKANKASNLQVKKTNQMEREGKFDISFRDGRSYTFWAKGLQMENTSTNFSSDSASRHHCRHHLLGPSRNWSTWLLGSLVLHNPEGFVYWRGMEMYMKCGWLMSIWVHLNAWCAPYYREGQNLYWFEHNSYRAKILLHGAIDICDDDRTGTLIFLHETVPSRFHRLAVCSPVRKAWQKFIRFNASRFIANDALDQCKQPVCNMQFSTTP